MNIMAALLENANTLIFLVTRVPKGEPVQESFLQSLFPVVLAAGIGAFIAYLFSRLLKEAEDAFAREKREVVRTRLVKTDVRTETSTSSAVGRAIIGDFVAGPIGAIVGASTAKEKDKSESTFIVFYKDGSSNVKIVANNSERYKFYLSKLER